MRSSLAGARKYNIQSSGMREQAYLLGLRAMQLGAL